MLNTLIILCALYFTAGIITYITYAIDKHAARKGTRRISESALHTMSLLGGWPGALLAQRTLRHKTIKKSFQRMYKLTVVLNIIITAWILITLAP